MIGRTNTGGGGSGGKIAVTAPAGATVTVSKDGKVKTKVAREDGVAVFSGLDNGTWTVTLYNEDGSANHSWEVSVSLEYPITVAFFDGYLYNSGDEREVFTGGWYLYTLGVTHNLIKEPTYMTLANGQYGDIAYAYTRMLIDTTGYNTLTFECRRKSSPTEAFFGIASEDKTIVSRRYFTSTKKTKEKLDISGYQGKYLLFFSCMTRTSGEYAYADVFSVKIE